MSLFKIAVVLSLGVALLPSDKGKQQQLYAETVQYVEQAVTYCERNAETCAQADAYWQQFKTKAQFAAGMVYEAYQRYSVAAAEQQHPDRNRALVTGQGTLTPGDLEPAWRGTVRRQGI